MFQLNEEQEALQSTVRSFVSDKIKPVASKYDESSEFPEQIIKEASKLGFMNLTIPSEYGGTGLSLFDACLVIEEISAGCGGMATSIVANDLALTPIVIAATNEQKQEFLKPIVENHKFASFCLSEPGAGSDAAGLSTTATKDGDHYILNGNKQWITNGGYADQYTVFATLDKNKGHKAICCFAVPANTPGVKPGKHENKMGQRCSNTVPIVFDNARIPAKCLIGKEGEGFKIAMKTLDWSRPMTAILAVGIAQAALQYSIDYSKDRKQFNQAIANFQGIQFMLADMATNIEAARLLTWKSAFMLDNGKSASIISSMAKRFAADMAMQVCTDAVQIYGGYGYTKEYPVEKLMRDVKLMQIYEGTSQIQRVVIARELLK
jgi:acyl-CoA dehydrogenase